MAPMVQCEPMEGELIHGLYARAVAVNAMQPDARWGAFNEVDPALQRAAKLHGIARISGVEAATLANKHSLLPFTCFAVESGESHEHGSPAADLRTRRELFTLSWPGLRYCRKCLKGDLQDRPFSHLRVDQQLPGALLCSIHQEPLRMFGAPGPALRPLVADPGGPEPPISACVEASLPFVEKYMALAQSVLRRPRPIHCWWLNELMRTLAREQGLLIGHKGNLETVANFIARKAPRSWLDHAFPGLRPESLNLLTKIRRQPSRTEIYLLAIVALAEGMKNPGTLLDDLSVGPPPAATRRLGNTMQATEPRTHGQSADSALALVNLTAANDALINQSTSTQNTGGGSVANTDRLRGQAEKLVDLAYQHLHFFRDAGAQAKVQCVFSLDEFKISIQAEIPSAADSPAMAKHSKTLD